MICECGKGNGFQMSFLPVTPSIKSESQWYTVLSGCLVPLPVVTCTTKQYALLIPITFTAAVPIQLVILLAVCLFQNLFHLGGHISEVFPTHRRKCPSSTFFKPWGSHPFSNSQVMAAIVSVLLREYGLLEINL